MQQHNEHLFLFAGEQSGDLHGSHLLKALKQLLPHFHYTGVGGPAMRDNGLQGPLRMEDFAVMGFSDVLRSLPQLIRQFRQIKESILDSHPKGVILIDYPGFNLRLAKALRKAGYRGKIVHYISPTVWAWGKNRISSMAETLDLLLTIYPFEKKHFEGTPLKVEYVGNPLREYIENYSYHPQWAEELGITNTLNLISLFPGSRKAEIERNLPKQIQALERLRKTDPECTFAISCAQEELRPVIERLCSDVPLVPRQYTYELMRHSRAAIAKSGTVTLELALHHCPTAVVYELSTLNRFVAKYLFRINLPHYCIVNILGEKEIFPEMIASGFTSEMIYDRIRPLFEEGAPRQTCLQECHKLSALLQEKSASRRAAQAIGELLRC